MRLAPGLVLLLVGSVSSPPDGPVAGPPPGAVTLTLEGPFAARAKEILDRPFLRTQPASESFTADPKLFRWLLD
ncbi:MAG TPA: hypothetical protein VNC50_17570, partial [Planctomycetia bacterium]|nr:hypothetical protein [Planctomycetia bacterium]